MGIFDFIKLIGRGFITYKKMMPVLFIGMYLIFIMSIATYHSFQQHSFKPIVEELATVTFAADYNIYKNLTSPTYNFLNAIEIIMNMLTIFYLIKFFNWFVAGGQNFQSFWTFFIAIIMLGILELSSIRFVDGIWFFPYYGIIFFFMHLPTFIGFVPPVIIEKLSNITAGNQTTVANVTEITLKNVSSYII